MSSITEGLVDGLIRWIQNLGSFWYVGLVVLMALETVIIIIPSEVIMPLAGFIVFSGGLGIIGLIVVAGFGAIGSLLGSLFIYYLALGGGRPLLLKYGRYSGITATDIQRAETWFEKHGGRAVLLCRLVPGLRSLISIPAGLTRMDMKRYVGYTLVGSFLWSLFLASIGYALGEGWHQIRDYSYLFDWAGIAVVIVLAVFVLLKYRQTKNRKSKLVSTNVNSQLETL